MSRQVKAKTHSGRSTSDIEENQARETYMAAEYRRRNPARAAKFRARKTA
jgi:hypothetical protein